MNEPPRHMVPLVIDTRFLRPLPKSLWDSACHHCDKRQSRWEMGPPYGGETYTVCSLCFLYESKWGEKRLDQISVLVQEVEAETGEKMLKAADGQSLLSCGDADRILSSIALTSRMFQMQDQVTALREAAGEGAEEPDDSGDPEPAGSSE